MVSFANWASAFGALLANRQIEFFEQRASDCRCWKLERHAAACTIIVLRMYVGTAEPISFAKFIFKRARWSDRNRMRGHTAREHRTNISMLDLFLSLFIFGNIESSRFPIPGRFWILVGAVCRMLKIDNVCRRTSGSFARSLQDKSHTLQTKLNTRNRHSFSTFCSVFRSVVFFLLLSFRFYFTRPTLWH